MAEVGDDSVALVAEVAFGLREPVAPVFEDHGVEQPAQSPEGHVGRRVQEAGESRFWKPSNR